MSFQLPYILAYDSILIIKPAFHWRETNSAIKACVEMKKGYLSLEANDKQLCSDDLFMCV